MKVLLDTDIGSDIDDAVCLAYLLAEPACDLLGITTVTGNPQARAELASSLCHHAGRDIPISPGAAMPLVVDQLQIDAPQREALARWPHRSEFGDSGAVDLMRGVIKANPDEVVLIAIGPLTNVALLCATDPDSASRLKGLVVMGGDFRLGSTSPEWNFLCDPHAAAITYRAPIPFTRTVGLDITEHVSMTQFEFRARFTAPSLGPVLDLADRWFRHSSTIVFHDPLAAATAFDDTACAFQCGRVEIDLAKGSAGVSRFVVDYAGRHEVAVDVEVYSFIDGLLRVVNSPG